ncbi:MAG TPA: metallophosphoesterase [Jatrophihabitantaceae bacterium]|jgi:predicted MPP superfamily phosphohydrolase
MSRWRRTMSGAVVLGAGTLAYGALIERNAFTLRRFDVPLLPAGAEKIRILHVSDLHIMARQRRKAEWIRGLADLEPDLVVNTGDTISEPDGIGAVMNALEPLFAFPGAFVPGNNDYYAPKPKNPARYFVPESTKVHGPRLPWPAMAAAMSDAGWVDLTHVRSSVSVKGGDVALAGTDDPHLKRARYHRIAGAADPSAVVRIGVTHSPEPYLLRAFADDGYDLVLAGHTHGGQIRIPFGPAIVTNCGIDVHRARWLHRWDEHMWFHICAGLGTNPYAPVRIACRPEASLLTLVPRR